MVLQTKIFTSLIVLLLLACGPDMIIHDVVEVDESVSAYSDQTFSDSESDDCASDPTCEEAEYTDDFITEGDLEGDSSAAEDETEDEDVESSSPILNVTYPVEESSFAFSSVFGPRLKASEDDRYDFHRGIDIPGTNGQEVFAIADGSFYKAYEEGSSSYPNGGNVVVISHNLDGVSSFHDQEVTRFYSVYMHLDSFGAAAQAYLSSAEQQSISQGDVIGVMGSSGDTDFTHLHLEIRMQTTCSLEYQLANPASSCAGYGFDPHVNPLEFFVDEVSSDQFTIALGEATDSEIEVVVYAESDALLVDGVLFDIYSDEAQTDLIYSKSLSFDSREGFDATSTTALDNSEVDGFVIEPESFTSASTSYLMTFKASIPDDVWEGRSEIFPKATLITTKGEMETVEASITK